ncbi:MAG: polysaccharide export protein [Sphingomonadaceae bacterium]|nr:polysaccharide export protein [Sphingomonadaceae bacterium]
MTQPALNVDYRIAPMDKLSIRVFKFDDLSGDYSVDLVGNISMPLIGTVRVINLSTDELRIELTKRLGERYLQAPDVSVGIKESSGSVITVEGSVRQPGLYPIAGPLTLLQAVATARGYDENANPRRVAIFRTIDGKRQAAAFDLVSIRRGAMSDPPVYRGDIVVVDGSNTKSVFKNILQTLPVLALFRPF